MSAAGGPDIPPDWETWQEQILCPRCGYDLRMLTAPRCPECGLRSTWRELTERTVYEDRTGLFEYWWRRRPIRSLISTLWRCAFPWLLWPRIPLVARPRIGPLLALVLVVALAPAAARILLRWLWGYVYYNRLTKQFPYGWPDFCWTILHGGLSGLQDAVLLHALAIGVLATMLLFRQSMTQHRVRAIHVVRIGILSSVGLVLWSSALLPLTFVPLTLRFAPGSALQWLLLDARDLLVLPLFVLSLGLGWSAHLRVRRGWAIPLLSTLVTLTALAVLLYHAVIYGGVGLNDDMVRRYEALWPMFTKLALEALF